MQIACLLDARPTGILGLSLLRRQALIDRNQAQNPVGTCGGRVARCRPAQPWPSPADPKSGPQFSCRSLRMAAWHAAPQAAEAELQHAAMSPDPVRPLKCCRNCCCCGCMCGDSTSHVVHRDQLLLTYGVLDTFQVSLNHVCQRLRDAPNCSGCCNLACSLL